MKIVLKENIKVSQLLVVTIIIVLDYGFSRHVIVYEGNILGQLLNGESVILTYHNNGFDHFIIS